MYGEQSAQFLRGSVPLSVGGMVDLIGNPQAQIVPESILEAQSKAKRSCILLTLPHLRFFRVCRA